MIKCSSCGAVYRWGRRHAWQSACPYCGCITFNPQEVDRIEYIKFLAEMGDNSAMEMLQRMLYNPHFEQV